MQKKKSTAKYSRIKLLKTKDKVLKAVRQKKTRHYKKGPSPENEDKNGYFQIKAENLFSASLHY